MVQSGRSLVVSGRAPAKCSSRRFVVLGETTASPECTCRIADSRSAGGVFFSKKPAAPALIAAKAYSSRSKVVSTITFGASGNDCNRRVASTPSRRGIRTSISTTSHAVTWIFSIALPPSPA